MHSANVVIAGQEFEICELRSRQNAAWRKELEVPFKELADQLEGAPVIELTDGASLAGLVRSVSGMLLGSIDQVIALLVAYEPRVSAVIDEAYDSELLDAFVEVLKLAYPFGGLLEKLKGFGSRIGQE